MPGPIDVTCPTCKAEPTVECTGGYPHRTREASARVMARREVEAAERRETFDRGLAKVREALEAARGA